MKFEDKLLKLRKEKNLTQSELAKKINIIRQAISKWESGSSFPDFENITKFCEFFSCSKEFLLLDNLQNESTEMDSLSLGQKIAKLRKNNYLTQEQLADLININTGKINFNL